MCACDGLFTCSRCEGTRDEPGYPDWLDVDDDMPLGDAESRSNALDVLGP